jgi:xanthine dehydrogenase YagS FAD-binding subunit
MKRFRHHNAQTIDEVVRLLEEYRGEAALNAGGTDLIGLLKDDILPRYPKIVINLKSISGLDSIRQESGHLVLGALTRLADIAGSGMEERFTALSEAAHAVGSPQIRYAGTLGGNLAQAVRCWYYRASKWTGRTYLCKRKGGTACYAATGDNRLHSIFGMSKGCCAVHPSDLAVALISLNATAITNKRTIGLEALFDGLTGTVLEPDEILTGIHVPMPPPGTRSGYRSFRLRKALSFPLVSCAATIRMKNGTVENARIVLGAVAPTPYRARAAEAYLKGRSLDEEFAALAGQEAVNEAKPLEMNGYKVQITKNLVARTLLGLRG